MLKVTLTTATPLKKSVLESFKKALIKKYGRELEFVLNVDSTVIGGVKAVMGSKAIDLTVAGKLAQLRKQLLAKI